MQMYGWSGLTDDLELTPTSCRGLSYNARLDYCYYVKNILHISMKDRIEIVVCGTGSLQLSRV
uniref:Uncharacterized protein n=1 Tax=Anguilla anguilla TaxID=7936 RepID=A0A0E9R0W0_ANGAN